MFVFLGLFVHAAVRGGTCAFTLKIVSTLIQKQLTRREASDLDIEASHGEPGSCRARPVNADDGLEDMRRIRGLVCEKLPAASYALLQPEKRPIFCHRRGIEIFCRLFSTQQRPNLFVSDAWPAPAAYHRSFYEQCDQKVDKAYANGNCILIFLKVRF